jgi:hypothetical protein
VRFIKIDSPADIDERLRHFADYLRDQWDWAHPVRIDWKRWTNPRTLSQNNLLWMWLTEMAEHFSRKGTVYTPDDMHDLVCHKFLGYEDRRVGNTEIKHQLRGTSTLDKGEFQNFMEQIDAWAADHGLLLTHPADSEYAKLREVEA